MKIFIKNMVCARCRMIVKYELDLQSIKYRSVELGEVFLEEVLTSEQLIFFNYRLKEYGLEVIDASYAILVERIKVLIIETIRGDEIDKTPKLPEYLSEKLDHNYKYLNRLFSNAQGSTIPQFLIDQKIECVKDLLKKGDMTLSQIAYRLNYSSVAHLSNQFKARTGTNPTEFVRLAISPAGEAS